MPSYKLLSFDIGATKTNATLFVGHPKAPFALKSQQISESFQNSDLGGPEEIIAACLEAVGTPVDIMVLAVAGPVTLNSAELTNRAWTFDRDRLRIRFGVSHLFMINDLEAIALGVPYLKPDEIYTVNNRPPVEQATMAVIAPGTGLGESFMTWSRGRYVAHPSEGGHSDFAPIDALQIELLQFLMQHYEHVSYERICSGLGLQNIYRFLKEHAGIQEPAWLADKIAEENDFAKTVVAVANDLSRPCDICRQTVSLFVAVLGAEAGNLALRTLPRGGIYIGGGISPHILPYFTTGSFTAAFTRKGRMKQLLETFPISIILNPRIPLYGAAYFGLQSIA